MAKKLRIAILYNEPMGLGSTERQFISETGKLQAEPARATSTRRRPKPPAPTQQVPVLAGEDYVPVLLRFFRRRATATAS